MAEEEAIVPKQLLITHGVEFDAFLAAGLGRGDAPADVAQLKRPRVGFIGGIDAHTFDPDLFLAVSQRVPEAAFAMIGSCSLPEGWCPHPNVHILGRRPYEDIARYMAAMDVLIMPWNRSEWIKACNPVKLKEYLAVGRPVVTTDFPALQGWRDLVRVADDAETFAAAIRAALAEPCAAETARVRVAGESWDVKARLVAEAILDLGVSFVPATQGAEGRSPRVPSAAGAA
jgi:glycosyltransferase involved in cell wall biosynthesis